LFRLINFIILLLEGMLAKQTKRFSDAYCTPHAPAISAVTSVEFCPYNPNVLASAGYDGILKVNDTKNGKLFFKTLIIYLENSFGKGVKALDQQKFTKSIQE
jgi:WD40 repeat protein